jgi:hypothetical protein
MLAIASIEAAEIEDAVTPNEFTSPTSRRSRTPTAVELTNRGDADLGGLRWPWR